MNRKKLYVFGHEGTLLSLLRWTLTEFEEDVDIRHFGTLDKFYGAIESVSLDILILDSDVLKASLVQFIQGLRDRHPSLKVVLIAPPTAKDQVMQIIRANLVKGVVLKPFTKEIICNYVGKLL